MKSRRISTARAKASPSLVLPSGVVLQFGDFRLYARQKARRRERDLAARTPAEKERLQRKNSLISLDDTPLEVKEKILSPFC